MNALEFLGLQQDHKAIIKKWAETRSVTLRLSSEEKCTFLREETRKVTSPTEHVTEVKGLFGTTTITDKVVTTITGTSVVLRSYFLLEYFWDFQVSYELFMFFGNDPTEKVSLNSRKGNFTLKTTSKDTPHPQVSVQPNKDLNITFFLKNISQDFTTPAFSIDRKNKDCRTPKRNPDSDAATDFFTEMSEWAEFVRNYFRNKIFVIQYSSTLHKISSSAVFVPVIPFFEAVDLSKQPEQSGALTNFQKHLSETKVLRASDIPLYLKEQQRSFAELMTYLKPDFPEDNTLHSFSTVKVAVIADHMYEIAVPVIAGIWHIERVIYDQLFAAVGKLVSPVDFFNYMEYHNRTIFRPEFLPLPFMYHIRRPGQFPQGTLSIERQLTDGSPELPLKTFVRRMAMEIPMKIPIDGTTKIPITGTRYLNCFAVFIFRYVHGCILHKFAEETGVTMALRARANQFSMYIMLIGTIGPDTFYPKYAAVLRNRGLRWIFLDFFNSCR